MVKITMNGKSVTLRRPISCLYPREVLLESDTDINNATVDVEMANVADDLISYSRPVREAAQQVLRTNPQVDM